MGGRYREVGKQWEKESADHEERMQEGLLKPKITWGSEMRCVLYWGGSVCHLRVSKWQNAGGAQRTRWFRLFLTPCGPAARSLSKIPLSLLLQSRKCPECTSEQPGQDGAGAAARHPNFTPSHEKWATFAQTKPQTLSLSILPRWPLLLRSLSLV